MQISYAFLAEAVQLTSDGKLNILGADLAALHVQSFPWVQPAMALLVCVEFDSQDCGRPYQFTAVMHAPDGTPVEPRLEQQIVPPVPQVPDRLGQIRLVVQINNLAFAAPGLYQMQISIRDLERNQVQETRVRLRVLEVPVQTPAA